MREAVPSKVIAALLTDTFVASFKSNPNLNRLRREYETAAVNLKKLSDAGVTIAFGGGLRHAQSLSGLL